MEVTNEAFGDHVFRGTAQSIIEEMEASKPGIIERDVEVPSDGVSPNPLHKRASVRAKLSSLARSQEVLMTLTWHP